MRGINAGQHGVYGSNIPWWPDEHYELIAKAGFSSVIVRTDTSPEVAERLEEAGFRVIVQTLEHFAGNPWANPRDVAETYFARAAPFAKYSEYLIVENEPNVHEERAGQWYGEQFCRYIRAVWAYFKWLDPGSHWKLISPAMCNLPDRYPLRWYQACRETFESFDFIGVHCYWQSVWQRDNPEWGELYRWVRKLFPKKAMMITEYGNSNPQASDDERIRDYVAFLSKLPRYVVSAHLFILGGTDDWKIFHLNKRIAEGLEEAIE